MKGKNDLPVPLQVLPVDWPAPSSLPRVDPRCRPCSYPGPPLTPPLPHPPAHTHTPRCSQVRTVQLPGRSLRKSEKSACRISKISAPVADAIAALIGGDTQFALWGHGFGALCAFETARHLEVRCGSLCVALSMQQCIQYFQVYL